MRGEKEGEKKEKKAKKERKREKKEKEKERKERERERERERKVEKMCPASLTRVSEYTLGGLLRSKKEEKRRAICAPVYIL